MAELPDVRFITICPEGHDAVAMLYREDVGIALTLPTSKYWCSVCQRFWVMTNEERTRLREALDAATRS